MSSYNTIIKFNDVIYLTSDAMLWQCVVGDYLTLESPNYRIYKIITLQSYANNYVTCDIMCVQTKLLHTNQYLVKEYHRIKVTKATPLLTFLETKTLL